MSNLTICTTINRDSFEYDVTITFSAFCVFPASRACWDDPGYAAEYECEFIGAELDCPDSADDRLTEAELATLRTWLVQHHDRAEQAANDNEVGATP